MCLCRYVKLKSINTLLPSIKWKYHLCSHALVLDIKKGFFTFLLELISAKVKLNWLVALSYATIGTTSRNAKKLFEHFYHDCFNEGMKLCKVCFTKPLGESCSKQNSRRVYFVWYMILTLFKHFSLGKFLWFQVEKQLTYSILIDEKLLKSPCLQECYFNSNISKLMTE